MCKLHAAKFQAEQKVPTVLEGKFFYKGLTNMSNGDFFEDITYWEKG